MNKGKDTDGAQKEAMKVIEEHHMKRIGVSTNKVAQWGTKPTLINVPTMLNWGKEQQSNTGG